MNITELYANTPVDRHQEIVFSGDRLYFDEEEYIIEGDRELRLIRSYKGLDRKLDQIMTRLAIT